MAALLVAGFVGLFSETALNIALGDLINIRDFICIYHQLLSSCS